MRRTLATLVLFTSLAAAPHHHGFFEPLWSLLSSLWGGAKEGCSWDPHGRCAPEQTKAGCEWDPNGRCLAAPQSQPLETDEGCGMDPSGHCNPGS